MALLDEGKIMTQRFTEESDLHRFAETIRADYPVMQGREMINL
jgi:hypothetical protein